MGGELRGGVNPVHFGIKSAYLKLKGKNNFKKRI
jgi:hypothetical protein